MNLNFDRMAKLAGVESEEKKLLNESATSLKESDEQRIRDIIREELEAALDTALAKREQKAFDDARETKSLVQAAHFANTSRYGRIQPAPSPTTNQSGRVTGMPGYVGGLGFH